MAVPNFLPRSQPLDPTALVGPMQQKVMAEFQAQEAKRERHRKAVTDILSAVEQGQAIASNAMKLAGERRKNEGIKELTAAFSAQDTPVTRATPTQGPMTESGQAPAPALGRTTLGATPEGQASIQSRLLQAATKIAPEKGADHIFENSFPSSSGMAGRATPTSLQLPDGTQAVGYFDPTRKGYFLQDGSEAPMGTTRAYKYDFKQDSSGNYMPLSGSTGTQVRPTVNTSGEAPAPEAQGTVTNVAQLPAETRKEVVKALNTSQADPVIKKEKEIYLGMTRLEKAVESNNKAIVRKLGLVFQRALGDTGNIALAEQASPGSSKLIDRARQAWDTYIATGELTEDNKRIVMDAAAVLRAVSYDNYNQAVDIETDKLTTTYPQLNRDYIKKSIGGTLSIMPKPTANRTATGAPAGDLDSQIAQTKAMIKTLRDALNAQPKRK